MNSFKALGAVLCCAFMLAAGPAAAQSAKGFYVGVGGGINFLQDTDFDVLGTVNVENEYDSGFTLSGYGGYDFGAVWPLGGVRLEGEFAYRDNGIDVHSVPALGGDQPGSDGDASSFAFMTNAYNDFLPKSKFRPYVGAGIGVVRVDFSDYGIAAIPDVLDDSDTVFAWQAMGGIAYDLTEKVTFGAEYRYFSAEPTFTTSAATGSVENDVDYRNHSLLFKFNYRL